MQQIVKEPESIISWLIRIMYDAVRTVVFGNGHAEQHRLLLIMQNELDRRDYDNMVLARELEELQVQVERLKATNQELEQAALVDLLTRLFNRRGAETELDRALAPFKRHGYGLDLSALPWIGVTVTVIDLNSFKPINDVHGHAAGDEVLQTIADLLKRTFRGDDIVVRWGGDEFVVYAIGAAQDTILQRSKVLISSLADFHWPGGECVTCSIGIAHGKFQTERGAQELIRLLMPAADAAMYEAKRQLGSGSCIATAPDDVFCNTSIGNCLELARSHFDRPHVLSVERSFFSTICRLM